MLAVYRGAGVEAKLTIGALGSLESDSWILRLVDLQDARAAAGLLTTYTDWRRLDIP